MSAFLFTKRKNKPLLVKQHDVFYLNNGSFADPVQENLPCFVTSLSLERRNLVEKTVQST